MERRCAIPPPVMRGMYLVAPIDGVMDMVRAGPSECAEVYSHTVADAAMMASGLSLFLRRERMLEVSDFEHTREVEVRIVSWNMHHRIRSPAARVKAWDLLVYSPDGST